MMENLKNGNLMISTLGLQVGIDSSHGDIPIGGSEQEHTFLLGEQDVTASSQVSIIGGCSEREDKGEHDVTESPQGIIIGGCSVREAKGEKIISKDCHGEIIRHPKHRQVKHKKVKESFPREQRMMKDPLREVFGHSKHQQVKHKRVKERATGEKKGIDASQGKIDGCSEKENMHVTGFDCPDCSNFQMDLAKKALAFYKKEHKDTEGFEVVRVLYSFHMLSCRKLPLPSLFKRGDDWCHILFIAESRNNGCDNVSSKHFFAELYEFWGEFNLEFCQTLDLNDTEISYGCGFCPPDEKFPHPEFFSQGNWPYPRKASHGQMAEHHHQAFQNQKKPKKGSQWDPNRKVKMPGWSYKREPVHSERQYAETALAYYEKKKDAEFEIVEVVYVKELPFCFPGPVEYGGWSHVGFTAKPKNTNDGDDSPKRFFGELKLDESERELTAVNCSIVEPSDAGISNGCGFCPAEDKYFHPADKEAYSCGHWEL